MYDCPCYRIVEEFEGRVSKTLSFNSIDRIRDTLEGNLRKGSVIRVYRKGGRKKLLEVRG